MKAESPAVHAGVGYQVELVCVVYSEPAADVLWYKVRNYTLCDIFSINK